MKKIVIFIMVLMSLLLTGCVDDVKTEENVIHETTEDAKSEETVIFEKEEPIIKQTADETSSEIKEEMPEGYYPDEYTDPPVENYYDQHPKSGLYKCTMSAFYDSEGDPVSLDTPNYFANIQTDGEMLLFDDLNDGSDIVIFKRLDPVTFSTEKWSPLEVDLLWDDEDNQVIVLTMDEDFNLVSAWIYTYEGE